MTNKSSYKNFGCDSYNETTIVPSYAGIVLGIVATVLNTMVGFAAFRLNKRAQRQAKLRRTTLVKSLVRCHAITYLFIIHQSIANAMESSSLMGMNTYVLYDTAGTTVVWLACCIIREFSMLVSLCQIAYATVERYWCMIFPLRVAKTLVLKAIATGIWFSCLLLSIPDAVPLIRNFSPSNCQPAYTSFSFLNVPSKQYFIIVALVPVLVTLVTSQLILKNLRVVKKTKMFTYNTPAKALQGATSLTKRIAFSMLVQILMSSVFITFVHVPMSISLDIVKISYVLLSVHSVINPLTAVLSYGRIRQTIKGSLGISRKRVYHMRVKYVPNSHFPVALVQYKSYNSTL